MHRSHSKLNGNRLILFMLIILSFNVNISDPLTIHLKCHIIFSVGRWKLRFFNDFLCLQLSAISSLLVDELVSTVEKRWSFNSAETGTSQSTTPELYGFNANWISPVFAISAHSVGFGIFEAAPKKLHGSIILMLKCYFITQLLLVIPNEWRGYFTVGWPTGHWPFDGIRWKALCPNNYIV